MSPCPPHLQGEMVLSRGLTAAPRAQLGGRSQPGTKGLGKLPSGVQSLTILHHSCLLLLHRGRPGLCSLQGPAQHPECPALAHTSPSWPSLLPPPVPQTRAHGGSWAQSSYLGSCLDTQQGNTTPVPSLPLLLTFGFFSRSASVFGPSKCSTWRKETQTGVGKAPGAPRL